MINYASKRLLGIHLDSDAMSTVWFDARLKELQKKVDAALPQTINTLHCADDCLKAPVVLVESASDRQPTSYFIYTIAGGAVVGLGSIHPDIKPAQMGARTFDHYPARDGRAIPVYVTMPPGAPQGTAPAVVLVHGGPHVRGGSWEWDGQAQFLASRGYVVIQPEFRGSTGFGAQHFQAGWKQWGQTMQHDLADAALWADEKRLGRSAARRHHGRQLRRLCDLDGPDRKPRPLPLRRRVGRRHRHRPDVQHRRLDDASGRRPASTACAR